ncbi:MAG: HDIG domain-containing protein [Pirellulales bacterium]|nr:HDIG domain-containing protein [Pirellulales bacterium]
MVNGGQKRTRSERVAALELPPRKWERALANLRQRDVLFRIALCVLAAVAISLVIRSWRPPFAFRSGYVLTRDLTARVPFEIVDPAATAMARDRARWEVRYVYAIDSEPLVRLRGALRNKALEVMRAETYAELDPSVWSEFQPTSQQIAGGPSPQEAQERFRRFRDKLVGDQNLAEFEKAVAAALVPFEERGLLDRLPQQSWQGNQDEIIVYPVKHPNEQKTVKVSDVLIGKATAVHESLQRHLGSADVADPVFEWLRPRLPNTLTWDESETERARNVAAAEVKPVVVSYESGQKVAEAAAPLLAEQVHVLRQEHEAAMVQRTLGARLSRAAAVVLLILGLLAVCTPHVLTQERRLVVSMKRLSVLLALMVGTVGVSVLLAQWPSIEFGHLEIIPILLFGQTVAIAYRQDLAMLLTAVVAVIVVLGTGAGLLGFLFLVGVSATAVLQLGRIRSRTKLLYVGLWSSVTAAVLTVLVGVLENQPIQAPMLFSAGANVLWTIGAGFLMSGLLPFVESLFGVLTDISLLELGDVAHPLLQELIRRAPSTYNHSITVGSIAEAAAEAIGARGLLVRVGAYFHDIGKMLKPGYFIENQSRDENRHDSLLPAMSTLVIIAHIKDGADLARQHNLPEPIIDFIEQHHGTTLVEYFYGRANQQQREADPNAGEVDESTYRYPGPRPQTKESGVLMLADAVESASRSLVDPAPARIESLVREVADRKLDDGQFDESGLTLRELRAIENSMIKSLTAIYHGRVKYPEQKTA